MAKLPIDISTIETTINERWRIIDWERYFPTWMRPGKVRILMYAEAPVTFGHTSMNFRGLSYVHTLLTARAYPYVDFDVTYANRNTDPTAPAQSNKMLTDLEIVNNCDEVWLFGVSSGSRLTADEVRELTQFMAAPKYGGIRHTGDHASLGQGIAGQIPRAGAMRRYPAPPDFGPIWNTTLDDGSNADFDFDDQSDDVPQTIRYKTYRLRGLASRYLRPVRPHPVLCGSNGPVDVLPDHQHEGEAIAPVPVLGRSCAADKAWPPGSAGGHSPAGKIQDLFGTKAGQEIRVIVRVQWS